MITTGPYSLAAGTSLTVYDPAKYTTANSSVQVQNDSGFSLVVSVGGLSLPVPPRTIVTVPTATSPQVIITPSSVAGSSSSGALTLLWMLAGERSPVADGPITISTTLSATVSFSTSSVTNTVGVGSPATTITFARDALSQQVACSLVSGGTSGSEPYTITGNVSGTVYASGTITGPNVTLNFSLAVANGDTGLVAAIPGVFAGFGSTSTSPCYLTTQVTPTTSSISVIYQILTSQAGFSGCLVDQLGAVVAGSSFDLGQAPGAYTVTIPITSVTDQLAQQVFGAGLGTDWKVLAVSALE